jgi:phosphoribosylanthranilate isomerase
MFQIKICGVTNVEDALSAAHAGADAIGLNFYSGSARSVSPDQAASIVAALPTGIVKVGVFVNSTSDEIRAIAARLSLDLVQLHGNEPPEFLARLNELPVLRAFRLGSDGVCSVSSYLCECRRLSAMPRMVLLDAYRSGEYGGTGQTLDWTLAEAYHQFDAPPPLVLAGGLDALNVASAIVRVRPAAVDVASGVELDRRRKDPYKIAAFVTAAREAFAKIPTQPKNNANNKG